jgi:serine-type D-Ala-D-Ala carboxypeptidase/endopeptidase (penicillin-binding protein 4)
MVTLLRAAEREPWGELLRKTLPTGGQGTLEGRLEGMPIRAKTGTLQEVSALSGWLRLRRARARAEFSILSTGLTKWVAAQLEDRIVAILHRRAR